MRYRKWWLIVVGLAVVLAVIAWQASGNPLVGFAAGLVMLAFGAVLMLAGRIYPSE